MIVSSNSINIDTLNGLVKYWALVQNMVLWLRALLHFVGMLTKSSMASLKVHLHHLDVDPGHHLLPDQEYDQPLGFVALAHHLDICS